MPYPRRLIDVVSREVYTAICVRMDVIPAMVNTSERKSLISDFCRVIKDPNALQRKR